MLVYNAASNMKSKYVLNILNLYLWQQDMLIWSWLLNVTSFRGLLDNKDRKLAQTLNSNFRYINDVLSLNNAWFGDCLHLSYPNELEVKDTTELPRGCIWPWYRQRRKLKNKTLRQTRWLHFPNTQFPFHK